MLKRVILSFLVRKIYAEITLLIDENSRTLLGCVRGFFLYNFQLSINLAELA